MARIPFYRLPRKQQVAVIMSLKERGLWGIFKPAEKFSNFNKWVRDASRQLSKKGYSTTPDHLMWPQKSYSSAGYKDIGANRLYNDLRRASDPDVVSSVDSMFRSWYQSPAARESPLMHYTQKGITNPLRFGAPTGLGMIVRPSRVEYLSQIRAINQAILKKQFPSGKITLWRGITGDQADQIIALRRSGKRYSINHHFLTSYTESRETAASYGKIVLQTTLPIERSAYSWRVAGHAVDEEHILFGGSLPSDKFKITLSRMMKF